MVYAEETRAMYESRQSVAELGNAFIHIESVNLDDLPIWTSRDECEKNGVDHKDFIMELASKITHTCPLCKEETMFDLTSWYQEACPDFGGKFTFLENKHYRFCCEYCSGRIIFWAKSDEDFIEKWNAGHWHTIDEGDE